MRERTAIPPRPVTIAIAWPCFIHGAHSETVTHIESFAFAAIGVNQNRSVGEHAVNIKTQQLDLRGRSG